MSAAAIKARPPYLDKPAWVGTEAATDLRTWRHQCAAGKRSLDAGLGSFLEDPRVRDRLKGSVLLFTSDHGEALAERTDWDHGHRLDDRLIRVPFVLRVPGAAPKRIGTPASLVDVLPTLTSLGGAPPVPGAQGQDLGPILVGEGAPDRPTFAHGIKYKSRFHAVRVGDHRLVADRVDGTLRLFDVAADPLEEQDLAASVPGVRDPLADVMRAHWKTLTPRPELAGGAVELDEETRAQLKALGYLD